MKLQTFDPVLIFNLLCSAVSCTSSVPTDVNPEPNLNTTVVLTDDRHSSLSKPTEVVSKIQNDKPEFHYTLIEKIASTCYSELTSKFMDRRRNFVRGLQYLCEYEKLSSDDFDKIVIDEIKKNVVAGQTYDSSSLYKFIGVSRLFNEMNSHGLFEYLASEDPLIKSNFDFLGQILSGLKSKGALNEIEYVPYGQAVNSFMASYETVVNEMSMLKELNLIPIFLKLFTDISELCGEKFVEFLMSRNEYKVQKSNGVIRLNFADPLFDRSSPELSDPEKLFSVLCAGKFMKSLKKKIEKIDDIFNEFTEAVEELSTDDSDLFAKHSSLFYSLTNDYLLIRSIVKVITSIPDYNDKTVFAWAAIKHLKREPTHKLAFKISTCAINIYMRAIGDNDAYYFLKSEFFNKENLEWWFVNEIYKSISISKIGRINGEGLCEYVIKYLDKIDGVVHEIEKTGIVNTPQFSFAHDSLHSLTGVVKIFSNSQDQKSALNILNNLQKRIKNIKDILEENDD